MAGIVNGFLNEFDEEMKSFDKEEQEYVPLYKVISDNKIPVSKKEGSLWRSRLEIARKEIKDSSEMWKNIIDEYRGVCGVKDDKSKRLRLNEQDKVYENLLWSNTNGINRETIMKQPKIELTGNDSKSSEYASILTEAINNYMGQVGNNGLNIEEKLKKIDIASQLTNRGILRLDWNNPVNIDEVKASIQKKEKELLSAKDVEEVKEIEGELFALNEKLEASGFSGVQFTLVDPSHLFVDPNAQLESCLDADWIIEERAEYESVIKAKYKNEDGTSVYSGKEDGGADEVDEDFIIGEEDEGVKVDNKIIKTYYVWDKLKKRIYLYAEGSWEYPLWVWEDTMNLKQFFPYFILSYNKNPLDKNAEPEVAYYLPLQRELNKINSQISTSRDRAFNITMYNKRLTTNTELKNATNGKNGFVGFDLPEGVDFKNVLSPMITPALSENTLRDKYDLYQTIGKMCSADNITRGEEYKTNTTNMAIQQYGGAKKTIIGIRINSIVGFYKKISIEVLRLIMSNFRLEDWAKITSMQNAEFMISNPIDFDNLNMKIAADDTLEPTSTIKKQEAMQLMQVLGQFAGASPMVSFVMLKMLSKAFDDVNVTKDEWDMILNSLSQQQQMPMPPQNGMGVPNNIDTVGLAVNQPQM